MQVEAAGAPSAANQSSNKLANDFDDFLTLLTTQLQHQDPLDPMDSGEFTQQLVAFAGVEQQIRTNQNLEELASLSRLNNIGNVASYLGNEALIEAPFGDHTTDGIKWQYTHGKEAETVKLQVLAEDDTVIYEADGKTSVGLHKFDWDGKNNDGQLADAGNYRLKVTAKDDEGKAITTGIAVQETITAVNTTSSTPIFTVGPNAVPQSDILSLVKDPS